MCTHKLNYAINSIGIPEFRENLATYLESQNPVAITRHGSTIGIYVPTRRKPSETDLAALRTAGEKMRSLIEAAGATEDGSLSEFQKTRSGAQKRKS